MALPAGTSWVPLRLILACALSVASFSVSRTARAGDPRALRYDTRIDAAVTLTAGLWLATSEILKRDLVPDKCRWCSRAADGAPTLNGYDGQVRSTLVWKDTAAADTASSVLAFAAIPALSIGGSLASAADAHALRYAPVDALIVTEATLLAINVNQAVKYAFARERPFVRWLPHAGNALPALTESPTDENLSFFSGHTTLAFALAVSSGTVASLRDYRAAPIVWATGITLATAVGYLRIAADKHYLTDVLTGVVVGSLVGVGVPLIFHGRRSEPTTTTSSSSSVTPPPANAPLSLRGEW